jgi:hypothetical protein
MDAAGMTSALNIVVVILIVYVQYPPIDQNCLAPRCGVINVLA